MAIAHRRSLTAVLSLLVGVSLGCASTTRSDGVKVKKSGIHAVVVGPKPEKITIDELHLNADDGDVAFWVSRERGKKLYIEFSEQPFVNMRQERNGRFRVDCRGRQCYSDEISPDARHKHPYKYWQVLDDGVNKPVEADGIIIIDP